MGSIGQAGFSGRRPDSAGIRMELGKARRNQEKSDE
jgi:hypothetical protein